MNTYNTPEVVEELEYIEAKIQPILNEYKKRIFISGSTAGLGQLAAKYLIARGHSVVLHARNQERAADAKRDMPEAEAILIGDLSNLEETKTLAAAINKLGSFDVIIHNAGVFRVNNELILKVNSLSPYILSCLINKPKQLIFISSDMHRGGDLNLAQMNKASPRISYSDSKLQILALSMALARKWKDVKVNALSPGYVPTLMGGSGAPGNLRQGYMTQVWLAEGIDKEAQVSGQYFYHQKNASYNKIADDVELQNQLLKVYELITGIPLPN